MRVTYNHLIAQNFDNSSPFKQILGFRFYFKKRTFVVYKIFVNFDYNLLFIYINFFIIIILYLIYYSNISKSNLRHFNI